MTSRLYGILGSLPCVFAIGAAAPVAATNGYFSDGYGIKAEGVAGAGIAFPQDALTIATNPAGLTVPDPEFDAGVDGVCGIANLSPRSLTATLTFISVAMVTLFAVRHLGLP